VAELTLRPKAPLDADMPELLERSQDDALGLRVWNDGSAEVLAHCDEGIRVAEPPQAGVAGA
jgi:hypothetical protein